MEYRRLAYFRWRGCCFRFEVFRISSSGHLLDPSRRHGNIDFRYFFPCNRQLTRLQGGVANESHLLTFHDVAFCHVFCNNVIDTWTTTSLFIFPLWILQLLYILSNCKNCKLLPREYVIWRLFKFIYLLISDIHKFAIWNCNNNFLIKH